MQTMLLTGGNGFVGRQVRRGLAARGVKQRLVLRDGQSSPQELTDTVFSPDIFAENAGWWARACDGVDTVVHVAWYAEPGKYLHAPQNLSCLAGTLALAEGARRAGVRRLVGVGTCFEYDLSHRVLAIDTPLNPATPYAACKAAAYLALSRSLPKAGMSFAWCRPFYLYGEGEDARRLVPYLRKQLASGAKAELTSGRQIRDFMDIAAAGDNIAAAALCAIEGPVNICSGVPITVRQLAERIADEYGRRDLLDFGARPDNATDPDCVLGIPTPLPATTEKDQT